MQFSDLRLAEPILRAIAEEQYSTATPIQAQAIPFALEGRDVLGAAQTGTGKTAAFALPILNRLAQTPATSRKLRCLILAPTRELASQINQSFKTYGKHLKLRSGVIFGGVGQNPQVQMLRQGIDILIATPGRLLDLMNQRLADVSGVEILVLDEADRMLDMGFIRDIQKIAEHLPKKRQTMLFSATMPEEIRKLAEQMLSNPAKVNVAPVSSTADNIEQSVYFVEKANKGKLLAELYHALPMSRTIVFTRTKHGADKVVRHLKTAGIHAEAIHGNKSQNNRQRALDNFKRNKISMLVATDIASRGIDVDGITHVVNYDLSHEPETYVHRIGRTARAGAAGCAVTFCGPEERGNLRAVERLIKRSIPVKSNHAMHSQAAADSQAAQTTATGHPDDAHSRREPRPFTPRPQQFRRTEQQRPQPRREQQQAGHSHGQPRSNGNGHPHPSNRPQHPAASHGRPHAPRPSAPSHGGGQHRRPFREPIGEAPGAFQGPGGGIRKRKVHRKGQRRPAHAQ
jgi:ATP-dependent RNA helicase RhlE